MDLFDRALCFAVEKHSGQKRKPNDPPYILHPAEVAAIVGTMTNDQETLAAAVLHDTVEDAGVTLEEIEELFGKRVSLLVMTETENKREELPPAETWKLRKEETLIMLEHTHDISVKMMWLGDKLSNMRSFCRMYREKGNALWESFNQKDPAMQAWYYRTVAKSLRELENFDAYREYVNLVNIVFGSISGGI
ncbi:MAG: HD domain-containing protein [Clostridia bacterium]|nr:HD domain-containing protein [Clostridia bacterium]